MRWVLEYIDSSSGSVESRVVFYPLGKRELYIDYSPETGLVNKAYFLPTTMSPASSNYESSK